MRGVVLWMLTLSLLSGCGSGVVLPYARELGDAALVRTVGLDAWEEGVLLTASVEEGDGKGTVLSASAPSVSAAVRAVRGLREGYIYYGHADRLLLGEELATRGLAEVMDYLAREPQLGPGMELWVVRAGGAAQAVEAARAGLRSERLSEDGGPGAGGVDCSAARLMSVLARRGSVYVPALRPVSDGDEGAEQTLMPDGYAVLRQGKLVCFTDGETSRGVELLEEENGGDVVVLTLEDGIGVSLVTEDARVVCRPVFRKEELVGLDVICRVNARVAQTGRRLKEREPEELVGRLERLLGERIVRAIELGQYWDADFLDLERRTRLAAPRRKTEIREQWADAFRTLGLRVEVLGRIERSTGVMEELG